MRKVSGIAQNGAVVPSSGWSSGIVSAYHDSTGYTFFDIGPVAKQIVNPSSIGSFTNDAIDLYREFYARSDGRMYIGASLSTANNKSVVQYISDICGSAPKFLSVEFETAYSGNRQVFIQALKDHAALGGVIGIHDHPDNFVTGGNYADLTGSSLQSIKAAGAKRAVFLAYLDEVAGAIAELSPYTVIYRPWHEMNGNWFWWGGVSQVADMVTIWQDTVNYLRITKGLTNVLFSWNINGASYSGDVTNNAVTPYATWWPGSQYVDFISMDQYDNGASPVLLRNATVIASWKALMLLASQYNKPIYFAEIGSQTGSKDIYGFWERYVFDIIDAYPGCAALATWNGAYAPQPGTPAAASFASGVSRYGKLLSKY